VNFLKNHTGIVSALILGVAVVSSAFLLTREAPLTDRAVASPSSALRSEIIEKDSDNDGLLDWEEELWGTDPFVVDSDGDGILDGEFVAARKKDKSTVEILADENLNFSARFSRDFFGAYLEFKADEVLTEAEQGQLIKIMLDGTQPNLPAITSVAEITTTPTSIEAQEIYLRDTLQAIQNATPKGVLESEIVLLEKAFEGNQIYLLDNVMQIAGGYGTLSVTLSGMAAPKSFAQQHAALITATERLAVIIAAFGNADEDPLYALAALPAYEEETLRLARTLSNLIDAVVYESGESKETGESLKSAFGL